MENKITDIQILVKDIDAYLSNKTAGEEFPPIVLDILLEKTRQLYDSLTKLKNTPTVIVEKHEEVIPQEPQPEHTIQQEATVVVNEPVHTEQQEVAQTVQAQQPVVEDVITSIEPEPIQTESVQQVQVEPQVQTQIQPQEQPKETTSFQVNESHPQSIGEALQSRATQQQDLGSKLSKKPISDINTGIALGDRFSIIAQLFNHSEEKMRATIAVLNKANNFEEAMKYLKDNFNWDFEDRKVQKFISVVEQRFL